VRPIPPRAGERREVPPQAIYDRTKNEKKDPAVNVMPAPPSRECGADDWGWCKQLERMIKKQ
jgi:hypothetical protein